MTDDEKQHITEDETVRLTIRESMKPKQPAFLAFLNSPLGIWVMTSIIVGLISWQYSRYTEHQENKARTAAQLSKSKFDLLVLCDIGVVNISSKTKLSYNDISSTATLFRYEPGISGERGHRFSIIEVLNEISSLSPNDKRIAAFRRRSYELLRKANTILDNYRGWRSSSNPDDPMYDVKLSDEEKMVIDKITTLLREMRAFTENAS